VLGTHEVMKDSHTSMLELWS